MSMSTVAVAMEIDSTSEKPQPFDSVSDSKLEHEFQSTSRSVPLMSDAIEVFPSVLTKEFLLTPDAEGRIPLYRAIAQNDLVSVKRMLANFTQLQLHRLEWDCNFQATKGRPAWVYCKPWMQQFDKHTKELYEYLENIFKSNLFSAPTLFYRFRPLEIFIAKKEAGWNNLIIAILDGDYDATCRILQQSPLSTQHIDMRGNNALMHAIAEGSIVLANKVMAEGGLVTQVLNVDKVLGNNALSLAVVTLNPFASFIDNLLNSVDNMVKKELLLHRAYKGKTALMLACEMPNEKVVERLVMDADQDVLLMKDEIGCFALFHAIWNAKVDAVHALLQKCPEEQLLPIEKDMGIPVWQYAENLARRIKIKFSDSPYELETDVTAARRTAYLKIAEIIKKKYQELKSQATVMAHIASQNSTSRVPTPAFVLQAANRKKSSSSSSSSSSRSNSENNEDTEMTVPQAVNPNASNTAQKAQDWSAIFPSEVTTPPRVLPTGTVSPVPGQELFEQNDTRAQANAQGVVPNYPGSSQAAMCQIPGCLGSNHPVLSQAQMCQIPGCLGPQDHMSSAPFSPNADTSAVHSMADEVLAEGIVVRNDETEQQSPLLFTRKDKQFTPRRGGLRKGSSGSSQPLESNGKPASGENSQPTKGLKRGYEEISNSSVSDATTLATAAELSAKKAKAK